MRSNAEYTFLLRNVGLIMAVLYLIFFALASSGYLKDDNGRAPQFDIWDYIIHIGAALLLLIVHLIWSRHVVLVEVDQQAISLLDARPPARYQWHQIQSVRTFWLSAPPIYVLKIEPDQRDEHLLSFYAFVTEPKFAWWGFFSTDLSEMGALINEKKRRYSL